MASDESGVVQAIFNLPTAESRRPRGEQVRTGAESRCRAVLDKVGDFLVRGGDGPEHQELLRLIGTLVEGGPSHA